MSCGTLCKKLLLAGGYLLYLLLGAAVFQSLERGAEDNIKSDTERHRLAFLNNYTCLSKDAVDHLINVITVAVKQGINPLLQSNTTDTNWDFSSSFFFAGTVVTTIGYGTLAPRTAWGQIFCMFYALFGIPLNVIFLGQVGKALSVWCKKLWTHLFNKGMEKKRAKMWTVLFFSTSGVIVFLGIPPMVFTVTEGWSYREGVYYAFISLSTIGFGDYVAGYGLNTEKPLRSYRAFILVWIIFGLAWLALLFNLLTSLLEDTEKKLARDLHRKAKKKSEQERAVDWEKSGQVPEKEEVMALAESKRNKTDPRGDDNKLLEL